MDTRVLKKFATYVGVIVGSSLAVTLLNLSLEKFTGMSLLGSVVVFLGLALYGIYQFAQSKVNYERIMEQDLIDKMSRNSN
jgi:high-affinity Fe2+/Pb2+ permease